MPGKTLPEALADVPDPRADNKRHPLPAILALSIAVALSGATTLLASAEGGRHPPRRAPARRQQSPPAAVHPRPSDRGGALGRPGLARHRRVGAQPPRARAGAGL